MARIGTSGWSYDHWEHVLYPPGTPSRQRLGLYTAQFDTVELNASFYRWPREVAFASWRRRLPDGFRMSVKAPRGLTHGKRLLSPEVWVDRIATCWHELGDRRGVLLVQLPPARSATTRGWTGSSAGCRGGCRSRSSCGTPAGTVEPVFELLERHGAAYCVMSGARLPCVLRATAPVVYVRLHGPTTTTSTPAPTPTTTCLVGRPGARVGGAGREVYAYFNNDGHGHAVRNARRLRELLGG